MALTGAKITRLPFPRVDRESKYFVARIVSGNECHFDSRINQPLERMLIGFCVAFGFLEHLAFRINGVCSIQCQGITKVDDFAFSRRHIDNFYIIKQDFGQVWLFTRNIIVELSLFAKSAAANQQTHHDCKTNL